MLSERLKSELKDYPDFPKKGIIFKDISPILINPDIFNELIENMSKRSVYKNADAIISIDSRGFIFGSAIAYQIKKPIILARKKNKLPGEVISKNYGLEYGQDSLSLQLLSISKFKSFAIVDDLLATGGTAKCIVDLLETQKKIISGVHVVIELSKLGGRYSLDCPVISEVKIT